VASWPRDQAKRDRYVRPTARAGSSVRGIRACPSQWDGQVEVVNELHRHEVMNEVYLVARGKALLRCADK
jgi:hypothetical protein